MEILADKIQWKKFIKTLLPATSYIIPATSFAQVGGLGTLLGEIKTLVGLAIPTLVGVALLVLFWGLVKFIFAQGSETAKADC
mgnify:CR=1 FL=1